MMVSAYSPKERQWNNCVTQHYYDQRKYKKYPSIVSYQICPIWIIILLCLKSNGPITPCSPMNERNGGSKAIGYTRAIYSNGFAYVLNTKALDYKDSICWFYLSTPFVSYVYPLTVKNRDNIWWDSTKYWWTTERGWRRNSTRVRDDDKSTPLFSKEVNMRYDWRHESHIYMFNMSRKNLVYTPTHCCLSP